MRRAFPCVFIIIVIILILSSYSNTFYSPPIIDDYHSFIDEPSVYVKEWSVSSLMVLSKTFFGWARWIPMISFSFDHWIGKGSIAFFHITNLSIHIFCFFAVFLLVFNLIQIAKKGTSSRPVSGLLFSFFVAGVWALHPIQTNAVTYLVQRMASIQAFFYIMSVSFYVIGRRRHSEDHRITRALPSYLGCLVAGVGAFLSKENAAMLPVMLLATEIWFFSPNLQWSLWNRLRGSRKVLWVLASLVFLLAAWYIAIKVQHFAAGYGNRHFTLLQRLLTESRIVIWYLSLLVWPALSRMSIEHDVVLSTSLLDPPTTLFSLVTIFFLWFLIVRYRRRFPLSSYGGAWFFLNLLIESTFVPLELIFEHRLYLPSVGLALLFVCVVVSALGYLLANRSSMDAVKLTSCCFALIFSGFALLTFYRNQSWESKITIYEDATLKAPNNPRSHANLASAYGSAGFYEESIDEAELAIRLGQRSYEQYMVAANSIVASLFQLGRIEEAIARANELLIATPDESNATGLPFLYLNLARAYWRKGQLENAYSEAMRALWSLRQAGRGSLQVKHVEGILGVILKETANLQVDLDRDGVLDPGGLPIKTWIAKAFLKHGERREATKLLALASVENPEDVETFRLLEIIKKEDELNSTQAAKENMKEEYSSSPFSRFNAAMAMAILLRRDNLSAPFQGLGEKSLDYAIELQPGVANAHLLKAWYLRDRNETVQAIASAHQAIASDPDYAKAWAGLGFFLLESNQLEEAVAAFSRVLELYPGSPQRKTILEIISGIRENMPLSAESKNEQ